MFVSCIADLIYVYVLYKSFQGFTYFSVKLKEKKIKYIILCIGLVLLGVLFGLIPYLHNITPASTDFANFLYNCERPVKFTSTVLGIIPVLKYIGLCVFLVWTISNIVVKLKNYRNYPSILDSKCFGFIVLIIPLLITVITVLLQIGKTVFYFDI